MAERLLCRLLGHRWERIPSGGGLAGYEYSLRCRRCGAPGGEFDWEAGRG